MNIEFIYKLDSELNLEMHKANNDTSKINSDIKSVIQWLDTNKDKFVQMTGNSSEYDAVHDVVAEISDEFGYLA